MRGVLRLCAGIADDDDGGVQARPDGHQGGAPRAGAAWLRPPGQDAPSGGVARWRGLRQPARRTRCELKSGAQLVLLQRLRGCTGTPLAFPRHFPGCCAEQGPAPRPRALSTAATEYQA